MTDIAMPPLTRRVFCNRTLNLRSIRAVGFDMDYTLIQYRVQQWEEKAYEDVKGRLAERGWPVAEFRFDPDFVIPGLVVDREFGNVVKPNRFGYVKRACHGTQALDFDTQRQVYSRLSVEPEQDRWLPINTLFGLSKACIYAQLVDLLEAGKLPEVHSFRDLYGIVSATLDQTHIEGELKAAIAADPDAYVQLDRELPQTLLDLKQAGKRLLLITNSDWTYSQAMMSHAFDRLLPGKKTWRDLFDLVFVSARKPRFFSENNPVFEVMEDSGLLQPVTGCIEPGRVYLGGSASLVEEQLELSGDEILYVGDHILADVHASKTLLRWRTALIVPELEAELSALADFAPRQVELDRLMADKEVLEYRHAQLRLEQQRRSKDKDKGKGKDAGKDAGKGGGKGKKNNASRSAAAIRRDLDAVRSALTDLDAAISPLARASGELANGRWGLLMRTGNDKSYLARQIETFADIYVARVSHLGAYGPFAYLRSHRGSLPHDADV